MKSPQSSCKFTIFYNEIDCSFLLILVVFNPSDSSTQFDLLEVLGIFTSSLLHLAHAL